MYNKEYRHKYYLNHKKEESARALKWQSKNKLKARKSTLASQKRKRIELRLEVLKFYGNKCKCCGEDNQRFLTIDHKKGGGRKHRIKWGNNNMCHIAKKEGFPDFLQILCFNCNFGKSLNNNICPHNEK